MKSWPDRAATDSSSPESHRPSASSGTPQGLRRFGVNGDMTRGEQRRCRHPESEPRGSLRRCLVCGYLYEGKAR